jgi:hypothetical protein
VLLTTGGPRVIDSGFSRVLNETPVTAAGSVIETPAYMSRPSTSKVSVRCERRVLGGVLVFAATWAGPFGMGPEDVLPHRVLRTEPALDEVPAALRLVVAACLSKDPGGRPELHDLLIDGVQVDKASWSSAGIRAEVALPPGSW